MLLVRFGADRGRALADHGSAGAWIAPLTEPLASGGTMQAACFRLEPGGRIGRHRAVVPQLFVLVEGRGLVSGADGVAHPIESGEAAFWAAGEEHETSTDDGLVAIVIESPRVRARV